MQVVVPFAGTDPKTRLAPVLESSERAAFARAMLADVLEAVRAVGFEPQVLATDPVAWTDDDLADVREAPVTVDRRPLTDAVNGVLAHHESVAIVMADLALATGDALERLLEPDVDVAIAPGRGGGTNALAVRHPAFRVDYHGASVRDHREIARRIGADLEVIDSFALATDVDEPADLAEVLLHGEGRARDWLVDAGFELVVEDGRVGIERT